MWLVYILQNKESSWRYIGCTSNLERRIKEHNLGQNLSTKNHLPLALIYTESCADQGAAFAREKQLKSYKGGVALKKLLGF
jgi:putative endonuclease